jgi:hypothetical protein
MPGSPVTQQQQHGGWGVGVYGMYMLMHRVLVFKAMCNHM